MFYLICFRAGGQNISQMIESCLLLYRNETNTHKIIIMSLSTPITDYLSEEEILGGKQVDLIDLITSRLFLKLHWNFSV